MSYRYIDQFPGLCMPALERRHFCLDRTAEFIGPPSAKRCPKCRPAGAAVTSARANERVKAKRKAARVARQCGEK